MRAPLQTFWGTWDGQQGAADGSWIQFLVLIQGIYFFIYNSGQAIEDILHHFGTFINCSIHHMIGSTDETEEDEKQDRHCESSGQAVKPSKPDGAVVAENSICDDAMWNILEVLSS